MVPGTRRSTGAVTVVVGWDPTTRVWIRVRSATWIAIHVAPTLSRRGRWIASA